MSQSFIRVRSKAELDRLVDSIGKNQKELQNTITEQAIGDQFTKAANAKAQAPVIEGLQGLVDKFDQRFFQSPELDANGNVVLNPDNKTVKVTKTNFVKMMNDLMTNNAALTKEIQDSSH